MELYGVVVYKRGRYGPVEVGREAVMALSGEEAMIKARKLGWSGSRFGFGVQSVEPIPRGMFLVEKN